MDFEENSTRPKSIEWLLIYQVEEQSNMCDFTVKVDNWEKKFHRCVLIQSPFFECVFRHEYKETQTGKIEIKLGTPATVEMAIMFLYGKIPYLTLDIAEMMMTLAEYFLIPELKSACVAWLQTVKVNEENLTKLIEIASLYDIDIKACIEFAKGRLDILFENEEFTRIDPDSVKYIFTEPGLSYISMDDKLNFLVKWTKVDPINKLGNAKDLVKLLDFRDNSRKMLKQFINDPIFRDITEGKVAAERTADEDSRHEVLIMNRTNGKQIFWCLDLIRNKWFKLDTGTITDFKVYYNIDILGVQNSESTIYFKKDMNSENKIVCLNLETFLYSTFPVVQMIDGFETPIKRIDQVTMYEDVCIITENRPFLREWHIKERDTRLVGKSNARNEERVRIKHQLAIVNICTFHIGKVVNDRIETKPLFSLLNGGMFSICMDRLFSFAFTDEPGERIILYYINDCKMETITEPTINACRDKICCAENGFVIYNNIRCIYLFRQGENALETKYQKTIIEFALSDHKSSNFKLYFFNDRWYRYFLNRYEDKYQFQWTTHYEMLAAENQENIHWTPLPLPIEASRCTSDTLQQIFHIRLQKCKLMCDIECPHCNRKNIRNYNCDRKNIRNYYFKSSRFFLESDDSSDSFDDYM